LTYSGDDRFLPWWKSVVGRAGRFLHAGDGQRAPVRLARHARTSPATVAGSPITWRQVNRTTR